MSTQDEWWKSAPQIAETMNEEWGVDRLVGRETPDGWEYAIVAWRHGSASLVVAFKNGTVRE